MNSEHSIKKEELENKINKLREEYRNAKIENRRLIEIRATILKRILEKLTKGQQVI